MENHRTALSKGQVVLVKYMDPKPVLDILQGKETLTFIQYRNIKEVQLTSDKNRELLDEIRPKAETGYKIFKDALASTGQPLLVQYLECIEQNEDTKDIEDELKAEICQPVQLKGVRGNLIENYLENYVKTELSPLMPEEQFHVDKLYVPLKMQMVVKRIAKQNKTNEEEKQEDEKTKEVNTWRDIFYDNDHLLNTVFLSADPGVGKTTFCRRLLSVWCRAHTDKQKHDCDTDNTSDGCAVDIEGENVNTMKLFDFLFFVSLRHSYNEAFIEDMIINQLNIDKDSVHHILGSAQFKCLVVLDGLDEWSPPANIQYNPRDLRGLPKTNHTGVFHSLYTTRPWKLLLIPQACTSNYREIKITGVQCEDSTTLVELFLMISGYCDSAEELSQEFRREIKRKNLIHLSTIPLVLKLLLCHWLETKTLKTSKCQVYGDVIELMIEHALIRNEDDVELKGELTLLSQTVKLNPLPACLLEQDFPKLNSYSAILLNVGKLSFHKLFSDTNNAKLIFRDQDLKKYDLDLELCSKLGILSQRPNLGKSLRYRERTITFLHKSFQEFYAALYISHTMEECLTQIKDKCTDYGSILEISNVFQFLGGMNPQCMTKVHEQIGELPEHDNKRFQKAISDMILNSAVESLSCNHNDFTIKIRVLFIKSRTFIKFMTYICLDYLRDIHVNNEEKEYFITTNVRLTHTEITHLLTASPHIRKVTMRGVGCKADSECGCLTSASDQVGGQQSLLEIQTGSMAICVSHMTECEIYRGSGMLNHIHSYPELQVLSLSNIQLTHTQITHLLTDSPQIRKVTLQYVDCEADSECECLTSASDQVGGQQSLLELQTGNMAICVSQMTECNIYRGSGMLNHIHSYPELQVLSLSYIQLTHTQITHLLTASPHIRKVTMQGVDCETDSECGCLTSASDQVGGQQSLLEIHTGNMALCVSHLTECAIGVGSGMFNHIHSYPELQVLDLSCIQLTHTQITHLLTDSPHIRNVTLRGVGCEADSECGCLTSASEEVVCQQSLLEIHTGNMALCVSHMTECTISRVSGMLNHIHRYPELQVLSLSGIQLTHTQITHLLTDSPHIRKVTMRGVGCEADSECGCLTSASDQVGGQQSLLELQTGNMAICVSHMTVCTIRRGSGMFNHIHRYPELQVLSLSGIQLTHTQITHLLTDSPHIRKVTMRGVGCEADSECGCLTSASDQVGGQQSLLEIQTGNMAICVSHMTECTISRGSGMLNHIHSYPELQVLSLSEIQLTHTQITHLLTDSPHIREVTLQNVDCEADSECGCLTSASDKVGGQQSLLEIQTGNMAICVSQMTECTISRGSGMLNHSGSGMLNCSGSGMFNHINSYPELQVLYLLDIQLTHTQITHLLTDSPHIRKVTMRGVGCEADSECGCLTSASDQVGGQQSLLEIHTGNMAICVSHMTECTISRGSQAFSHISETRSLQMFECSGIQETDIADSLRLLKSSLCLQEVAFRRYIIFLDGSSDYPIIFSHKTLLTILQGLSQSHGVNVTFEMIKLSPGGANTARDMVTAQGKFEILHFDENLFTDREENNIFSMTLQLNKK